MGDWIWESLPFLQPFYLRSHPSFSFSLPSLPSSLRLPPPFLPIPFRTSGQLLQPTLPEKPACLLPERAGLALSPSWFWVLQRPVSVSQWLSRLCPWAHSLLPWVGLCLCLVCPIPISCLLPCFLNLFHLHFRFDVLLDLNSSVSPSSKPSSLFIASLFTFFFF